MVLALINFGRCDLDGRLWLVLNYDHFFFPGRTFQRQLDVFDAGVFGFVLWLL